MGYLCYTHKPITVPCIDNHDMFSNLCEIYIFLIYFCVCVVNEWFLCITDGCFVCVKKKKPPASKYTYTHTLRNLWQYYYGDLESLLYWVCNLFINKIYCMSLSSNKKKTTICRYFSSAFVRKDVGGCEWFLSLNILFKKIINML